MSYIFDIAYWFKWTFAKLFFRRWCVICLIDRYVAYNGSYRQCDKALEVLPGSWYVVVRCKPVNEYLDVRYE